MQDGLASVGDQDLILLDLDNFLCCLSTNFRFHPHCSYAAKAGVVHCLQFLSLKICEW
jgi:hypothetical protein